MKAIIETILKPVIFIFSSKIMRRIILILIVSSAALAEFLILGIARRTFIFYNIDDGKLKVENRNLKRSDSEETNIIRYVNEALLGPVSHDLLPLFPGETKLNSLLYRDKIVYIDLSQEASLPPQEGGDIYKNYLTLYTGILRNFSFVNDVVFFIDGQAAYENVFSIKQRNDSFPLNSQDLRFWKN